MAAKNRCIIAFRERERERHVSVGDGHREKENVYGEYLRYHIES